MGAKISLTSPSFLRVILKIMVCMCAREREREKERERERERGTKRERDPRNGASLTPIPPLTYVSPSILSTGEGISWNYSSPRETTPRELFFLPGIWGQ